MEKNEGQEVNGAGDVRVDRLVSRTTRNKRRTVDIEKLKRLEKDATPVPWSYSHISDTVFDASGNQELFEGMSFDDGKFIEAFRNLAPELIALWEAVQIDRDNGEYEENMHRTDDALKALNEKAVAMVG